MGHWLSRCDVCCQDGLFGPKGTLGSVLTWNHNGKTARHRPLASSDLRQVLDNAQYGGHAVVRVPGFLPVAFPKPRYSLASNWDVVA